MQGRRKRCRDLWCVQGQKPQAGRNQAEGQSRKQVLASPVPPDEHGSDSSSMLSALYSSLKSPNEFPLIFPPFSSKGLFCMHVRVRAHSHTRTDRMQTEHSCLEFDETVKSIFLFISTHNYSWVIWSVTINKWERILPLSNLNMIKLDYYIPGTLVGDEDVGMKATKRRHT